MQFSLTYSPWRVHVRKVAGEDLHKIGESGLQRAKHWLDSSTRVKEIWQQTDVPMGELLHFPWTHGSREFSFDLGGTFRGEGLDGQAWVAEVKNYRNEGKLPGHFRNFLAKCYVALGHRPGRCDHFLWISWAPFQARDWDKHATSESVRKAVLHPDNIMSVFGVDNEKDAVAKLDAKRTVQVASRVWLITLCEQQEQLVLTKRHFTDVMAMLIAEQRLAP